MSKMTIKVRESKKNESTANIRYDVPIRNTTYASELKSLVSKLKTMGVSVEPKIYAEEDTANDYAEYKLFGANSSDSLVIIVSIHENHPTRIFAITNRGKLVMDGYGQTFEEALSALNLVEESKKKRSEKRTVQPPSYDVYTYDELSDEAKEKVKSWFLDIRREDDGDVFQDSCMDTLYDLFPNSDVKIEYSLSYSQGDGFNTYGTLSVDDLLNVDLSKITFTDSNITPLSDKDAIKAVCEKADVTSIALPENRRYGYSMADRIEVVPDYDVELTDEETALLSELEKFAQDVMGFLNKQNEDWGYEYFYEATDEEVADWANANDYEFTEDGELA